MIAWIVSILAFIVILVIIAIACVYCRNNQKNNNSNNNSNCSQSNVESFISSGGGGANYNPDTNSISGSNIYANSMIQNGKTWCDVVESTKKNNVASDGFNRLGAGPGNGFDKAYEAQVKTNEITCGRNGDNYIQNKQVNEIAKQINESTAPTSFTSLYNRGNQDCGKMIYTNNGLMGVMEEKYIDERSRNRNIYRVNDLVHIQGFDIDTNNIGSELSSTNFAKYLRNGKTQQRITAAGASADSPNENAIKSILNSDGQSTVLTLDPDAITNKIEKVNLGSCDAESFRSAKSADGKGLFVRTENR